MDHTQIDHLIKMANQIAANYPSTGSVEQRAAGVAGHLRRFWTPAMIRELDAHCAGDGDDLAPVAKRALQLLAV